MKKTLLLSLLTLSLTAFGQTNLMVGFAWEASPDTNAIGYNLYLNNTNNLLGKTNGLSLTAPITVFPLNTNNAVFATAYDTNNVESEPSNVIFVHRPSSVFSLTSTKQGNTSYNINWAASLNTNVNVYNIYLGTNVNNLTKIASITNRLNTTYAIYNSNLLYGAVNLVAVSAFNTNPISPPMNILESPLSTNLNIILPPRPPKSLRISVIVQSSTNLISWNSVTNYEYLADSDLPNEVFRAKLEIEKNIELVN